MDQKSKDSRAVCTYKLKKCILQALADLKTAVVVSDTSINNQVTTSIAYIHSFNNPIIKNHYYIINITSTEADLFVINQATQIENINHIIIIMDSLHAVQRIFDSSIHSYQIQLAIISREL